MTLFFEHQSKIISILDNTIKKYKLDIFFSPDYIIPFSQNKIEKYFKNRNNKINKKINLKKDKDNNKDRLNYKPVQFVPSIFIECYYRNLLYPITISFKNYKVLEKNRWIISFLTQEYENRKNFIKEFSNELNKKYGLIFNYDFNKSLSIFNISRNILLNDHNITNFKIDKYLLSNKSERPILNLAKDLLSYNLDSFKIYFTNIEKLFELFISHKELLLNQDIKIYLNILSNNFSEEISKFKKFDFNGVIIEKYDFNTLKDDTTFSKILKLPTTYFISEKYSPSISAGYNISSA